MFEHTQAYSGFSADDIARAKEFYGTASGSARPRRTEC